MEEFHWQSIHHLSPSMPAKEEERARAPLQEIADGGRSDKRQVSMTDVIMYKGHVGLGEA